MTKNTQDKLAIFFSRIALTVALFHFTDIPLYFGFCFACRPAKPPAGTDLATKSQKNQKSSYPHCHILLAILHASSMDKPGPKKEIKAKAVKTKTSFGRKT